jgi:hypothetical protein
MRKEVSPEYDIFCEAAGKTIHWKVSIKKTANISESHSVGTWIDVTPCLESNTPETIGCKTELSYGQFYSDQLKFVGLDIAWWKDNIFNCADQLELKIEFWINNLTADTITAFAGWVDKLKDAFVLKSDERKDTIEFTVNAYMEYAERFSGNRLCRQIKNEDVDGAGTPGILLLKIPGVFVTDANISGYALKKGIHTITFDGDTHCKLDTGEWVELSGSSGSVELANEEEDQKVQIYFSTANLIASDDEVEQKIIELSTGDTLPYTWYQYQFIFSILKELFLLIGITEYSFDDFRISTRDGRKIYSFYDCPPGGQSYVGKPRCILWDNTNLRLWLGVGTHVYHWNETTHIYTDIGIIASGYDIVRLFEDRITSGEIWGIVINASGTTKAFCITIATGLYNSWTLTGRGTADVPSNGARNFAYVVNNGADGSLFYCDTSNAGDKYKFDLSSKTESLILNGVAPLSNCAGWSNGTDYFFISDTRIIRRLTNSGGWTESVMNSGNPISAINDATDALYNSNENVTIITCPYGRIIQSYDHTADLLSTVYTDQNLLNLTYISGKIYGIIWADEWALPGYIQAGSITTIPGEYVPQVENCFNSFVYNATNDSCYGLLDTEQILFIYSSKVSMFVEEEIDGEGKTLIDILKELCIGFNLRPRVSTQKECHILRRADDNGAIITSGESIELNADRARDLSEECGVEGGADIVSVKNNTDETNYDGSDYDVTALDNEVIQPIDNPYIPTRLLKDYAYRFYQYFKNILTRHAVPTPLIPYFQYEPFDGADLNFFGKINTLIASVPKSGIIVGQNISRDGTTEFEVIA